MIETRNFRINELIKNKWSSLPPVEDSQIHDFTPRKRYHEQEHKGFRDSVFASGFNAKYSGKGERSEFIDSIHLE